MAHPPAACRRRRPPQSATFRSSRSSRGCSPPTSRRPPFAAGRDWVFTTAHGTPHGHRNVTQRGLQRAARTAGLNDDGWPPLRFHDLRHTFASHLILDLGLDVAQVSRILGHARITVTLDVYTHLFDDARHAREIRTLMTASPFAELLDSTTDPACPVLRLR